jgi:hypothetical protein
VPRIDRTDEDTFRVLSPTHRLAQRLRAVALAVVLGGAASVGYSELGCKAPAPPCDFATEDAARQTMVRLLRSQLAEDAGIVHPELLDRNGAEGEIVKAIIAARQATQAEQAIGLLQGGAPIVLDDRLRGFAAFTTDLCCDGPSFTALMYRCHVYVAPYLYLDVYSLDGDAGAGPPENGALTDLAQHVLADLGWAGAGPARRVEIASIFAHAVFGTVSRLATPLSAPFVQSLPAGGVQVDLRTSFSSNSIAGHRSKVEHVQLTFEPSGRLSMRGLGRSPGN